MVVRSKPKKSIKFPELSKLSCIQKIKLLFRLKKKMKRKGFDLTLLLLNKLIPKIKNKIEKQILITKPLDKFVLLENTIDDILLKNILTESKSKVKSKIKISKDKSKEL